MSLFDYGVNQLATKLKRNKSSIIKKKNNKVYITALKSTETTPGAMLRNIQVVPYTRYEVTIAGRNLTQKDVFCHVSEPGYPNSFIERDILMSTSEETIVSTFWTGNNEFIDIGVLIAGASRGDSFYMTCFVLKDYYATTGEGGDGIDSEVLDKLNKAITLDVINVTSDIPDENARSVPIKRTIPSRRRRLQDRALRQDRPLTDIVEETPTASSIVIKTSRKSRFQRRFTRMKGRSLSRTKSAKAETKRRSRSQHPSVRVNRANNQMVATGAVLENNQFGRTQITRNRGSQNFRDSQNRGIRSGNTGGSSGYTGGGADYDDGRLNSVSGENSGIFVGTKNTATGNYSTIMGGYGNTLTGDRSGVFGGDGNTVTADDSVAMGGKNNTITECPSSFICGVGNELKSDLLDLPHAESDENDLKARFVCGKYNSDTLTVDNRVKLLMVGNGTDENNKSNAFSVDNTGFAHIGRGMLVGNADFAEYFESRPKNNDKLSVGTVVSLDKDGFIEPCKIKDKAIGVISNSACIVGDSYNEEWHGKYLKDEFGSFTEKISPEYDPNRKYVPRELRPEWHVVGLVGKVPILKGQRIKGSWMRLDKINDNYIKYLIGT